MPKFLLMIGDVYEVEADDIDQASDKLTDYVSAVSDVAGVQELDEQVIQEYTIY